VCRVSDESPGPPKEWGYEQSDEWKIGCGSSADQDVAVTAAGGNRGSVCHCVSARHGRGAKGASANFDRAP